MRILMKISFPVEKFNRCVLEGNAGQKIQRILEEARPESVYFLAENGKRGGIMIVNIDKASDYPKFAEPWFLSFDAAVEFLPIMTPEDLQKSGLDELGKKWR